MTSYREASAATGDEQRGGNSLPDDGAPISSDIAYEHVWTNNSQRIPANELERVLQRVLSEHPDGSVVAISKDGLFRPVPEALQLHGQRAISGHTSALELVMPADIPAVIDAWKATLDHGAATVRVHPLENGESSMDLFFVDVRAHYGVLIGLAVRADGDAQLSDARGPQNLLRPRVTTARKSPLSEFLQVDSAFSLILGYTPEEVIGHRNLELIHPDDHARAIANWMDMLGAPGGTRQVRMRQRHRDGHWVWFEVTNHNRLEDPELACIIAEMIDISEEMAAQEFLRASEQLLRRLTESLPVGVLQIDVDGAVIHSNAGALQILRCSDASTFEASFARVAPGDVERLGLAVTSALTDLQDGDLEVTIVPPAGELRRCKVSLRSLADEDGHSTGALICIDDITEAARLREQLFERATFDALTRCYNRAATLANLEQSLAEAAGSPSGVAVIFIDLDGFKAVNDRRGHSAGDALLQRVAQCLTAVLRPGDLVGRFGGDEFVAIGAGVSSAEEAQAMGERISRALSRDIDPEPPNAAPASIGVAWSSGDEADADMLISQADAAMYLSKREGLGRPQRFIAPA